MVSLSATITSVLDIDLTGQDQSAWYEAGTSSAGCFSLASVLYTGSGSSSYELGEHVEFEIDLDAEVSHTSTGTTEHAGDFGLPEVESQGEFGTAGLTAFSLSGTGCYTFDATGSSSYGDYAAGIYAGGCYNLATLTHDESGQDSFTYVNK